MPSEKETKVYTPVIKDPNEYEDISPKDLGDTTGPKKNIDLSRAKSIKILSITKERLNGDTSDEYYGKCKSWSLTIAQLKTIIREFKSMSSVLQDLSYSYMPCRMIGKIKIDDIEFQYWVNAGSTLTLKNSDTTLYFGCSSKKCKSFFLTGEEHN